MHIEFLLNVFNEIKSNVSIIWNGREFSYRSLIENIEKSNFYINSEHIKPGMVVALEGDFSPNSIALLLALIKNECIIVPLENKATINKEKLFDIAKVEFVFKINDNDVITSENFSRDSNNNYYDEIREKKHPGLVLFTSGTSGEPKAAVHDFTALLQKFKTRRKALRTLNFLLFDHWGGLNTMFHVLSNGGVVIATKERLPKTICRLIEKHKIELLPASPTFLNLLLLSREYENYDMNSLKIISYGTEPMLESTLKRLKLNFPNANLLQTYGLIELGVMSTKSKNNDSLWVKVGGDGYDTRVVDGMLEIKAKSAMLGYLNAPNPFTEDGWFKTEDAVEVNGAYMKILGRKSDVINVGGNKVYPQEVETIIHEMDNIFDVTVYGVKNPIIGNYVCAKVVLLNNSNKKEFANELKKFCSTRMKKYMIPVKIEFPEGKLYGERYKKVRS